MFAWTLAIILGLAAWGFMRLVSKPVSKSLTGRAARLTDSLGEFDGARGADLVLGPACEEGVARLYEKMCVLEPSKWMGDSRIPGIVKKYKAIVSGREQDPEGRNVPSPEILGRPNPDYQRYLKNQRACIADGYKTAIKAARKAVREQEIREGFDEVLRKMGLPEGLIPWAITDERLDSYSEEQWRAVVKAMRAVSEKYGEELAKDMLMNFPEAEVLCSDEAAENFDALCQRDVPYNVSCSVVRGNMTMDQAERAASMVEEWDYGWDDAVTEVVTQDATKSVDAELRSIYTRQVNPRAKARG